LESPVSLNVENLESLQKTIAALTATPETPGAA